MAPSFKAFVAEFEKAALGVGTLQSYLGQRAAQGVGGAAALGKSLAGTAAKTTREAVQGMGGLERHRLSGVVEGGQAVRKMQSLPGKVGLGQTAQQTRQRVGQAIQQEAATGGSRQGGVPLSKAYEGYMTPSQTSYNADHVQHVMGLSQDQRWTPKGGPTKLMGGGFNTKQQAATTGVTPIVPAPGQTAVTKVAPSAPPIESSIKATVPPPGRLRRAPGLRPSQPVVG